MLLIGQAKFRVDFESFAYVIDQSKKNDQGSRCNEHVAKKVTRELKTRSEAIGNGGDEVFGLKQYKKESYKNSPM